MEEHAASAFSAESKPNKKPLQSTLASCLTYSSTLMMEMIYSSKTLLTVTGLHGIVSQKKRTDSITTALRTSYPARITHFHK
jgi:hypothetical protein